MEKTRVQSTFEIKSWDEKTWEGKPWKDVPGAKLTHAVVTKTYQGGLEGEGTSQSLTAYDDGGSASYVVLERVVGRLAGRAGSFVIQSSGAYDPNAGTATTAGVVVPGSATGDLKGLRGQADYRAKHGEAKVAMTLEYYFE